MLEFYCYHWDRVLLCCPGWPWTHSLPTSASQVDGITGVRHSVRLKPDLYKLVLAIDNVLCFSENSSFFCFVLMEMGAELRPRACHAGTVPIELHPIPFIWDRVSVSCPGPILLPQPPKWLELQVPCLAENSFRCSFLWLKSIHIPKFLVVTDFYVTHTHYNSPSLTIHILFLVNRFLSLGSLTPPF
jgi:hypothetical protein